MIFSIFYSIEFDSQYEGRERDSRWKNLLRHFCAGDYAMCREGRCCLSFFARDGLAGLFLPSVRDRILGLSRIDRTGRFR